MSQGKPVHRRTVLKAAAASACLSLAPFAAYAQKKRLLIGSTSSSSSQYGYFVAVSELLNKQLPDIDSSVTETGATMDNLRRMARNQVDFGLVTTNVMNAAYGGTGVFEGKPQDSRLLWVYSIVPQNVVVREDSGVKTMADLEGKKFNSGLKGSASEKTADSVLELFNIKPDIVRGSTGEIVDAIKDKRVVGYVKSGAGLKLDASSQEIAAFTPIRLIDLTEDEQTKIKEGMPEISIVDVPADDSTGIPAYSTWAFGLGVAARGDLDEETAYQIVKAVCEDDSRQARALSELKGVDLAEMTLKYASSPLHPGAIRYFKEQGLDVPERLMEG